MVHKKLFIMLAVLSFAAAIFADNPQLQPTKTAVKALRPDLIISEISIMPTNPYTTDAIVVKAVCKNNGVRTAAASHMRFKIGGESTPPVYAIESLAPGATRQWLREVHLTVAQNYRITVTADVNNEVTESNEGNNVKTFDFTVLAPGKADLIVKSITVSPAAPHVGDHVNISIKYANIGTATAVKFSTISTVGGEAPPAVPPTYHNIRPGHEFTENKTMTFTRAAAYLIKARIDTNNEIEELNETNNYREFIFTVR